MKDEAVKIGGWSSPIFMASFWIIFHGFIWIASHPSSKSWDVVVSPVLIPPTQDIGDDHDPFRESPFSII